MLLDRPTSATSKQIRQFGAISLVLLPSLAWLYGGDLRLLSICGFVGIAILALSFLFPRVISPIYLGISWLTFPIGLLVGELAMLAIFFFVFCPLGLLFRCIRRDELSIHQDSDQQSYWVDKKLNSDPISYYRQY
ncbi:MAG: hypothetical protein U0930_23195 [Pirellulales bacterium]